MMDMAEGFAMQGVRKDKVSWFKFKLDVNQTIQEHLSQATVQGDNKLQISRSKLL